MSTPQIILGILLFALVTAVLYVWGLRRSMTQNMDMEQLLLRKCAGKVVKYLKKNETITQKEISRLARDVQVGLFWSRKRLRVASPGPFAQKLANYMLEQQLVEEVRQGCYRLKV